LSNNSKRQIVIFHQHASPPGEPGITRHFQMGEILSSLGYQVTVVASNFNHFRRSSRESNQRIEKLGVVNFLWVPVNSYREGYLGRVLSMFIFAWRAFFVSRRRFSGEITAVIGSTPSLFCAFSAFLISRRWKAPFILEVRDLWPKTLVQLGKISPRHPLVILLAGLEKFLYRRSDRIVTVLPGAREHILANGGKAEKLEWIPNFVDLKNVPERQLSSSPKFLAVYAGSFGLANSVETIVEAADYLRKLPGSERIQFLLIGEGPRKTSIQKMVSDFGLSSIVEFGEAQKKPDVYDVLLRADVFLMPVLRSKLYDAGMSPNKLFDYMACARPTIFSVS